jgi:inorganic pyrophosphatase
VPVDALHPFYSDVIETSDLPHTLIEQIEHFFKHYKDLEKGKWVTIGQWVDSAGAAVLLAEAIARATAK